MPIGQADAWGAGKRLHSLMLTSTTLRITPAAAKSTASKWRQGGVPAIKTDDEHVAPAGAKRSKTGPEHAQTTPSATRPKTASRVDRAPRGAKQNSIVTRRPISRILTAQNHKQIPRHGIGCWTIQLSFGPAQAAKDQAEPHRSSLIYSLTVPRLL